MNNFKVEIFSYAKNGYIDYTPFAVFPVKAANLLDEQLDEAEIKLRGVPKSYINPVTDETVTNEEVFAPFTVCRLTLSNAPECALDNALNDILNANAETGVNAIYLDGTRIETKSYLFFVANDRSIEMPVGSGLFNHDLYLIELTKITERYICDTLTFTNELGADYAKNKNFLPFVLTTYDPTLALEFYSTYLVPFSANKAVTLQLPYTFFDNATKPDGSPLIPNPPEPFLVNGAGLFITNSSNENIYYKKYYYNDVVGSVNEDEFLVEEYKEGQTTITISSDGATDWATGNVELKFATAGIYNITYKSGAQGYFAKSKAVVVANRLSLKKWTITDVINRICETVEPIRVDMDYKIAYYPRFRLNGVRYKSGSLAKFEHEEGSTAGKLDKVLSPELSFTTSTLRECLQLVGSYIHGEPRIVDFAVFAPEPYFVIDFDFYGSEKLSKIKQQTPITYTLGTDINQYCTQLDSPTQNLTSSLEWAQGVTVEPFYGGYTSMRTDITTASLQDNNNSYIPTSLPLGVFGDKQSSLICRYNDVDYDITPFVYEVTDYNLLSSYNGAFPFAKAYALYYTIGQKNIYGLFFKNPDAVNPIFQKYAIVNILREATGNDSLDIDSNDILQLKFRVIYNANFSARIKTHKQCILPGPPTTLAYNQNANLVESRYYSEHLRGVVERIGTVQKTYTYILAYISQIPIVGTKYDENYYISNVAFEFLPGYIKCTVALSKNFNRLSDYVGINTMRRMWQVSERDAVERDINHSTYIVVSEKDENTEDLVDTQGTSLYLNHPAALLFNEIRFNKPVSIASVKTRNKKGETIENTLPLVLPVIASAFNTSMTFTFRFLDNYSAGQNITAQNNGIWGNYVEYCDYYGRFYFLDYILRGDELNKPDSANSVPELDLTYPDEPFIGRLTREIVVTQKDSREIIQVTNQITVVCDSPNIIIGTELCRNCSAVNISPKTIADDIKLYLSKTPFSPLQQTIKNEDIREYVLTSDNFIIDSTTNGDKLTILSSLVPSQPGTGIGDYKHVCIGKATPSEVIDVEDEDGNTTTQSVGGEKYILLAVNNHALWESDLVLYFTAKNRI